MVGRSLTPPEEHNPDMIFRSRALLFRGWLAGFLLLLTGDAMAWNAAGHRLIAVIAWQEMSGETRRQASALLEQHPAMPGWQRQLKRGQAAPEITPQALFAEASTWADDIRRDLRYTDRPGAAEGARNRDWHYVNWPVDRGALGKRGGRLDLALVEQIALLADTRRSPADRAIALAWLIHLVGDAHQPLHVASWPQADGSFDDGGLAFAVRDDAQPRFADTTLHSWWDDLPGPPWLRGEHLNQGAMALLERFPAANIRQGKEADWIGESFAIARDSVRPAAARAGSPWQVTADYRALAKKIGQRRLAESGVRLGRLLNQTLDQQAIDQTGVAGSVSAADRKR